MWGDNKTLSKSKRAFFLSIGSIEKTSRAAPAIFMFLRAEI